MEFIKALLLILVAEMGDKTQIVAMAFATRYKLHQILTGVAIGSAANHGLAILFGSMLGQYLDMRIIHSVAGALFFIFAFLSLDIEEADEEEEQQVKYGPVVTVAIAFFIGELGDKTQLTALSLSVDSVYPILTLMGTTAGMVLTSLLGILIAQKFGERIPEEIMKVLAAAAFLFFGFNKMLQAAGLIGIQILPVLLLSLLIMLVMAIRFRQFHIAVKAVHETKLQQRSAALYRTINIVRTGLESMCHGEEHCGTCQGHNCLIGYMKMILTRLENGEEIPGHLLKAVKHLIHRDVEYKTLYRTMKALLSYFNAHPEEFKKNQSLSQIRTALEALLMKEKPSNITTYIEYKKWIDKHLKEPTDITQIKLT